VVRGELIVIIEWSDPLPPGEFKAAVHRRHAYDHPSIEGMARISSLLCKVLESDTRVSYAVNRLFGARFAVIADNDNLDVLVRLRQR
jgi:hypothetical protein